MNSNFITRKRIIFFLLAYYLLLQLPFAYSQSNLRFKTFTTQTDTLSLDSLSVVPNTIAVRNTNGEVVDSSAFTVLAFQSKLIWKIKPAGDSVKMYFRVYPFSIGGETFHKNYSEYVYYSQHSLAKPFIYNPEGGAQKLIDFGNLDYNGSFSRSISFGSNQSVVLNSLFNLQLAGMVTKDLEITAAITDNNIPIQPDGNTQKIQEFDKIFIQLRKDNHKVIVGDYDLNSPLNDYFMKFAKKYQGGMYSGSFDVKKFGIVRTAAGAGIAKGKFSRNTLLVSEGNQGPYKLTGASGETFIVILANSEQVYINGQKMQRGADRDYVIDYNLGEITFTPRRIITKDLRVLVEFQYSERNYLRTGAFVNTETETKKVTAHFNLFSEQDSKQQSIQQSLNDEKKYFLATIGDSIQNARYRGWDSVAYDANRILYRLVADSLGFDSVFVFSTDTAAAKYSVSFSLVGNGNGDYVPLTSVANGRVYAWIAPFVDSTGIHHQGTYAPVIFLVTPKYQQLYTLGGEYRINNSNSIVADVAMSNYDQNMFSKRDDKDNLGFATRLGYKTSVTTKSDTSGLRKQSFDFNLNYEFLQNRFNTIERFRNIEFNRDWNVFLADKRYNEHLATVNAAYNWNGLGNISYRFKAYVQDSVYRGFENALNGNFSKNGFTAIFTNSYLNSSFTLTKTNFIRPKADFSYAVEKLRGWKFGVVYDHEVNVIKLKTSDTLAANSYLWQNYKVYATTPDTAKNKFAIELIMRYEHRPDGSSFAKPFFGAQTVNFTGQVASVKNQTLNYALTYRHSKDNDSLNSAQPEHFYLGRIDYNFTVLRGFIRSTTLYEVGSGRQQKTQVTFQASPTNQGDYVWKDANQNGIKELNEFVISPYKEDTSYIRVFVVAPEYVAVNSTQFNQVLNINPAAMWKNNGKFGKIISMFSLFASVQITKKTYTSRNKKVGDYFNPIPLQREDTATVSTTISSRNSFYFNRLEAKYGAQVDFNYSRNRTLLTTGFENRVLQSQGVSVRWNIFKSFNMQAAYINGMKANQSDFYSYLQYKFTYNDANIDLNYQFKTFLRIGVKYDFSVKVNPNDSVGNQTAQQHKVSFDMRYNRQNKSTVSANLTFASVKYIDKNFPNQQLEYAMLEGLQNGNNLVWTIGFEQNLTNNIQLTLSYDGRMTGFTAGDKSTMKPVHTGRAEVRALF